MGVARTGHSILPENRMRRVLQWNSPLCCKHMDLISAILSPERILLDAPATDRDQLFESVADLFSRDCGVVAHKIKDGLNQRESLGSTALGMGIAIPHQRIKGLKEALGAFVKPLGPIPFDAPDGAPVRLFFVMLVPEKSNETHLRLLAELAQRFSDRAFRELLDAAVTPASVIEAFRNWSAHAPGERSSAI